MPWSDNLLLGYAPMDDVHREFVELVDRLLRSADADLYERLEAFERHAERHFAEERQLMQSTQYPGGECHIDEHNAVLASVRQVLPLLKAGRVDVARSLSAELVRWFPQHAQYMDSSVAEWLVRRATGAYPLVFRRREESRER
jgi:hemerythrin